MYNREIIEKLIAFIELNNGIGDKTSLASSVQSEFGLVRDRSVFACNSFAIRFSNAASKRMSNTVLSLSALQKYDSLPFFVCIVTPKVNYLMLANSTYLKKISHSSKELRVDNIKGSFNGSDIMQSFEGLENTPSNFEQLYAYHLGFDENLERLVECTNGIVGRNSRFNIDDNRYQAIFASIQRAKDFVNASEYTELFDDLNCRVARVQNEIAIAALIDNVNIRGRVIEYLITDNEVDLKGKIISSLHNGAPLPKFKTEDKLGDYSRAFEAYYTETDIKTKVIFLDGNPKAYNIDKLLRFLAESKSVYLIYLLGIDNNGSIISRLCSVFDKRLIAGTNIIHHWAGRNSRGVAQFLGSALSQIISSAEKVIFDDNMTNEFVESLIQR